MLGPRFENAHLKEWSEEGTDFSPDAIGPLLDVTVKVPVTRPLTIV